MTWFQAQRSCESVGKRLCRNSEWQVAALGTPDEYAAEPDSDLQTCNIWTASKPAGAEWADEDNAVILTGTAPLCVSDVGASDMVGNLWEWVADWQVTGTRYLEYPQWGGVPWPDASYNNDGVWNADGSSYNHGGASECTTGLMAGIQRGGHWAGEQAAGVYAISMLNGPSVSTNDTGTRCCL
jgi:formylglycine-generating enzyme required for sulfatase activity